MRSNLVDLGSICLAILLASRLVFASSPGEECHAKIEKMSVRTEKHSHSPKLSSPEECARTCYAGEPPKICYYHFTLELYTVLGDACKLCTPNNTNPLQENCQCVTADGIERTILTVNRMLPGPSIEVCKGDKVVVDVMNNMEGMEATIHWHGVFQTGSQHFDGVPFVTQCPILQGNTFRYQWIAGNAGTHFWHSHSGLQKLDGISGSLIIREPAPEDPSSHLYDYDLSTHVMVLSDWMHELATERFPGRRKTRRGQTPTSVLINGKGQYTDRNNGNRTKTPLAVFTVKPGRRYRFRTINTFCTVCPAQLSIQSHRMTVIATDGEAVQPVDVDTIISFAGERYDFVMKANQPPGSYWIQLRGIGECGLDRVQQLGILRYKGGPDKLSSEPTYSKGLPQGVILNPLDAICHAPRKDAVCINQLKHAKPIDKGILGSHPDVKMFLSFSFHTYEPVEMFKPKTYHSFLVAPSGNLVTPFINGIAFKPPPSPLLSQIHDVPEEELCNKDKRPANCGKFCSCTHVIDVPLCAIVEIVIVDERGVANLSHPFHLHGHAFNVVGMGRSPDKNVTKMTLRHARDLDRRGLLKRNWDMVPFKDTIAVPNNGYSILRFRANNPGYWLFHCHFIFHIYIGMDVVIRVGTAKDLPPVPAKFPTCGNYLPPIKLAHENSVCRAKNSSFATRSGNCCSADHGLL